MSGLHLRAAVMIVASGLAACAPPTAEQAPAPTPVVTTSPAAAPTTSRDPATTLPAYRWQLRTATDAQGQSIADLFPVPERPLTVSFADGRVGVEGGCNRTGASYRLLDAGQLQVGQAMSTMMACAAPFERVDAAISTVLVGTLSAAIDGSDEAPELRLVSENGSTLTLTGMPTPETRFGGPGSVGFLEVAAQRGACGDPAAPDRQCLMVRERAFDANGIATGTPGEFRPLDADIEGYVPTVGERQVLRVKRFERAAPAGAEPAFHYVLDLVIETEIVAP